VHTVGERTVDRATIRSIGERIGSDTQEPLKNAMRKADAAQAVNISNWTAVTKSYAVAYTVAVEYATQSWDTKIDDASKLSDALAELANRWDEIEQASTITLEQALNAIEGTGTGA
jgi:tRNA U34 5-carboxymethylaminomethyl modifying GTPase MnmE/TrmE